MATMNEAKENLLEALRKIEIAKETLLNHRSSFETAVNMYYDEVERKYADDRNWYLNYVKEQFKLRDSILEKQQEVLLENDEKVIFDRTMFEPTVELLTNCPKIPLNIGKFPVYNLDQMLPKVAPFKLVLISQNFDVETMVGEVQFECFDASNKPFSIDSLNFSVKDEDGFLQNFGVLNDVCARESMICFSYGVRDTFSSGLIRLKIVVEEKRLLVDPFFLQIEHSNEEEKLPELGEDGRLLLSTEINDISRIEECVGYGEELFIVGDGAIRVYNWVSGVFLRKWTVDKSALIAVYNDELFAFEKSKFLVFDLFGTLKRSFGHSSHVSFILLAFTKVCCFALEGLIAMCSI
jgi:hypothetical protein